MALDAVPLMARRMGAEVSVYVDAQTARSGIWHTKPSVLLVEPRHLHCDLADYISSLRSQCESLRIVLMTTLTADELRATCLPICWDALLHKPFTYSRFEEVMRGMLKPGDWLLPSRDRRH